MLTDGLMPQQYHNSLLTRISRKWLLAKLKTLRPGTLSIIDADQQCYTDHVDTAAKLVLRIHHRAFYRKVMLGGVLGAAQAYLDGDWDTNHLVALLDLFFQNRKQLSFNHSISAKTMQWLRGLIHKMQPNTIGRSKHCIMQHYDLGNDFFRLFLDESMLYSCALFRQSSDDLATAQQQKLAHICQQLQLNAADHLLEIGTGWGAFAIYAAQHYGCRVTTTTISAQQYQYVKARLQALQLTDKVTLLQQDYRHLQGQFSKLVSIEMLEAIGYQYFATFFQQCNRLLADKGLLLIQTITINDAEYERAKNDIDFIKRYIFPGGCLPALNIIKRLLAANTTLALLDINDIGQHYVPTLQAWRNNFQQNKEKIQQMNFPAAFVRMWEFYFSYCEVGFANRYISDVQVLAQK